MAKKRKITNETAKKKLKELLKKYNGDVDKAKEELFNKYEFDYKTVVKEVLKELKAEQKQTKKTKQTSKETTKSRSTKKKITEFKEFELPTYTPPEPLDRDPKFVRKISDEEAFKQITKLKNDPQALLNFLKQHDFSSKKAVLDIIKKNPQGILELGEEDLNKGFSGKGKITLNLQQAIDVYKELLRKHNGDFDKALEELYQDYEVKDKKAFETLINYTKAKYQQKQKDIKGQLPQGEEKSLDKTSQEKSLVKAPQQTKEEVKTEAKIETPNTLTEAEKTTAEAVKEENKFSKVVEALKKCKGSKFCIFTVLGTLFGGTTLLNKSKQQPQEQTSIQLSQEQSQPQQKQEQQIPQIPLPSETSHSEYDDELKEVQQNFLQLADKLDKYRQAYDEAIAKLSQANEIYEKQLLEILPSIPLLLAKTPLNNMTNEDLIQHTNTLFTEMPYEDAISRVGSLVKGYYVAKMNGVDPKALTITDLLEIAENPVFAKSTNETLAQVLEQIGEVLKLKIKSNLDKIGAIKDMYGNLVKELHEQANIYKDILSAIKEKMIFETKMRDEDIKQFYDINKINIDYLRAMNQSNKNNNNSNDIRNIIGEIKNNLGQYSPNAQKDIQKDLYQFPNMVPLRVLTGKTQ